MRNKDKINILFYIIAGICFLVAVGVLYCFVHNVRVTYRCGNPVDMAATGQVGDFIGGIIGTVFGFIGTIFVILTLRAQRHQMRRESFDSTFQSLLALHRQNVSEMNITVNIGGKTKIYNGHDVFKGLVEEFDGIYGDIASAMLRIRRYDKKKTTMLKPYYLHKAMSVTYGCLMYSLFDYSDSEIDRIGYRRLMEKVQKYGLHKELHDLHRNSILSSYFRHLYNMVKFIDDSEILKKEEKIIYCNLIRSQLSDYEEILLFYNSMSVLGEWWNKPLGKENWKEMCLIAKYRLVKNCPSYWMYSGIKPNQVYYKERIAYENLGEQFFETQFPNIDKFDIMEK